MVQRSKMAAFALAGAATALALASCGSSSKATTSSSSAMTSRSTSAPAYEIKAASVSSVGTVLVNGKGLTVYLLSSEKGAKTFTCKSSNGCYAIWPPVLLPSGVASPKAGAGVSSSLLGTVKDPEGQTQVTYAGWPLYTFARDTGPGTANGQGIKAFGGTWWAVTPSGAPASKSSSATTSTTSSSGYGGY